VRLCYGCALFLQYVLTLDLLFSCSVPCLQVLAPSVLPLMRMMRPCDLEVLLTGGEVTAEAILSRLEFENFSSDSASPQWLMTAIRSLDRVSLLRFLVFVTGQPALPSESLSSHGRIRVRRHTSNSSQEAPLPMAHTCYCVLDLPDYEVSTYLCCDWLAELLLSR
jgi:hypothetical protein